MMLVSFSTGICLVRHASHFDYPHPCKNTSPFYAQVKAGKYPLHVRTCAAAAAGDQCHSKRAAPRRRKHRTTKVSLATIKSSQECLCNLPAFSMQLRLLLTVSRLHPFLATLSI